MRARYILCVVLVALLMLHGAVADSGDDEWDEEFEAGEDEAVVDGTYKAEHTVHEVPPAITLSVFNPRRDYTFELLGVFMVVVYGLTYIVGRKVNSNLAHKFVDTVSELLSSQFTSTGIPTGYYKGLVKDSQHGWRYFASGRQNCSAALLQISTQRRQDLISVLLSLLTPEEDTVTIDLALDQAVAMEPFVFAVCPRRQVKSRQAGSSDLRDYSSVVTDRLPKDFPSDLAILTDSKEVITELLTPKVVATLAAGSKYVTLIHVTDQRADMKDESIMNPEILVAPKAVRVVLKLPSVDRMSDLLPLLESVFSIMDSVPKVTLSKPAKTKAVECRRIVKQREHKSKLEERQEQVMARKEEKLRLEQEEYEKLTPAQRKKRDEKEAKKKAKLAAMPRMKVKTI